MRNRVRFFVVFVFALILCPGVANAGFYHGNYPDNNNPIINVSGDAEVWVAPDEIIIYAGMAEYSSNLDSAVSVVDITTNRVLKLTKDYKIKSRHVVTDHISITPKYDNNGQYLVGYHVRKSITITLKDINAFDSFMQDLVKAGCNVIHDVQFKTLELKKYREQVRAMAIKAAKEKAEKLTSEIGQTIGKAIQIDEGNYFYGYWGYNRFWNNHRMASSQNAYQSTDYNAPTPEGSVAVGQIRVFASINVVFELK